MFETVRTHKNLIIRDGELELAEVIANTFNKYFSTIASQYTDYKNVRLQTYHKYFASDKLDGEFSIPEIIEPKMTKTFMAHRPHKSTGADTTVSTTSLIFVNIMSGTFHHKKTAINHLVHTWAVAIAKGLVNGVVLLDLGKALHSVNHTVLLEKLTIFGCSHLIGWLVRT